MGTGWRRAFCTTISQRDPDQSSVSEKQQKRSPSPSPSPRSCTRLNFFSSSSNPTTPRLQSQSSSSSAQSLRCRTNSETANVQASNTTTTTAIINESPRLECKTTRTPKTSKSPRTLLGSNPTSPRSPLKLSLFKNSFKFRVSYTCIYIFKDSALAYVYTLFHHFNNWVLFIFAE